MKSNFMIQAEIDIAAHPEWNDAEKAVCLFKASIKEATLKPYKKEKQTLTRDALDALIDSVRAIEYRSQPVP